MAKLCLRHRTTCTYLEDGRALHQISASQITVAQMTQRKREVRGLFMWTVKSIIRSEQIREYPCTDTQQLQTTAKLPPVKAKRAKNFLKFLTSVPPDLCNAEVSMKCSWDNVGLCASFAKFLRPRGGAFGQMTHTTCITPSLYTHVLYVHGQGRKKVLACLGKGKTCCFQC